MLSEEQLFSYFLNFCVQLSMQFPIFSGFKMCYVCTKSLFVILRYRYFFPTKQHVAMHSLTVGSVQREHLEHSWQGAPGERGCWQKWSYPLIDTRQRQHIWAPQRQDMRLQPSDLMRPVPHLWHFLMRAAVIFSSLKKKKTGLERARKMKKKEKHYGP